MYAAYQMQTGNSKQGAFGYGVMALPHTLLTANLKAPFLESIRSSTCSYYILLWLDESSVRGGDVEILRFSLAYRPDITTSLFLQRL